MGNGNKKTAKKRDSLKMKEKKNHKKDRKIINAISALVIFSYAFVFSLCSVYNYSSKLGYTLAILYAIYKKVNKKYRLWFLFYYCIYYFKNYNHI